MPDWALWGVVVPLWAIVVLLVCVYFAVRHVAEAHAVIAEHIAGWNLDRYKKLAAEIQDFFHGDIGDLESQLRDIESDLRDIEKNTNPHKGVDGGRP